MGIKQLFSIIKDEAPDAIKEGEIKNQFGRKVAIVRVPGCPWVGLEVVESADDVCRTPR